MKRFDQTALVQFHQLVSSHIGLNIRKEDRASFSRLLAERIQSTKCDEAVWYFSLLESDTRASRLEWKELIARLTTGESYFFRDKGHFFLLQNIILPELIKTGRSCRTLRIWSAGCSTGEEPYSIAILLDRFFPGLRDWEVLILGTDINERSLEKARRGIYTDWSFRRMDEEVQREYFARNKDLWSIDDRIKKMVTFRQGNLIAEELSGSNSEIRNMDIILCRNVFIYFKSEMVSGVIDRCIPILNEGGYLITGHGELYGNECNGLQKILFPEAVIYRKNSGYNKEASGFKKQTTDVAIPKTMTAHPAIYPTIYPAASLRRANRPSPEAVKKGNGGAVGGSDHFDGILSGARKSANAGDYENAQTACRRAIHIRPLSAEPYFLLAHIAEAKGNDEEAKNFFKKVIYLDATSVPAYLEIAGLYEKENDLPRAKKMRETAKALLQSLPTQAMVQPYDGTAEELLKYVEYVMEANNGGAAPAVREGVRER